MTIDSNKGDGSNSRDRHFNGFKCRNECEKSLRPKEVSSGHFIHCQGDNQ